MRPLHRLGIGLAIATSLVVVVAFVVVVLVPRPRSPQAQQVAVPSAPSTAASPEAKSLWPDSSDTGVPPGTSLTSSGPLTITQPGMVISGLDVAGCILVRANNVTIKDSRVRGSCPGNRLNIDTGTNNYTGILLEDVEIDGMDSQSGAGIGYSGYTCLRCNVHGVGQGLVANTNVTIKDSWVHDLYYADDQHIEAFLSNGGSNFTLEHNNFDASTSAGTTAAVSLFGDFAPISDVVIKDNLLNAGAAYCLYAGTQAGKAFPNGSNVTVVGNTFGTKYNPRCGWAGPTADWDASRGDTWSGNVWQGSGETGRPVTHALGSGRY